MTAAKQSGCSDAASIEITTSYGACRGRVTKSGVRLWRGIPYAHVPRRFTRSVKSEGWEGIRDCTKVREHAIQPGPQTLMRGPIGKFVNTMLGPTAGGELEAPSSEQCLHLNIQAPPRDDILRPVMVFIHGGAFLVGGCEARMYRGTHLVEHGDVVLVTINYRLGVFGFLNLEGRDSNCGIWDQYMALQWVSEEIRNFGGDPNCVTIFGESAGGMSCGTLLGCPRAEPLFHRAILMSGALSNCTSQSDAASITRQFCEVMTTTPQQLCELSANELLSLQARYYQSPRVGFMPFQPCVDGDLIVCSLLSAVRDDRVHLADKQIMLGTCKEEWRLFSPQFLPRALVKKKALCNVSRRAARSEGFSDENEYPAAGPKQSQDRRDLLTLFKLIRSENKLDSWNETFDAYMTMRVFTAPCRLAARELSNKARSVWVYEYAFDAGFLGACHAAELPLIFGTWGGGWFLRNLSGMKADPHKATGVANHLVDCFAAFARAGSPTSAAAAWKEPYTSSRPSLYRFDATPSADIDSTNPEAAVNLCVELLEKSPRPIGVKLWNQMSRL